MAVRTVFAYGADPVPDCPAKMFRIQLIFIGMHYSLHPISDFEAGVDPSVDIVMIVLLCATNH